jgi:hypothetical protein
MRATGVLLLGALVLHELRYGLAYGAGADEALARHGHAYLEQLLPALVALSGALIAGALVGPLTGRIGDGRMGHGPMRRATLYAGLLLAVFSAQELTEAWLAAGHPDGIAALLGHGGWIAVPLSLVLGAIAAVATRGLERVERRIAAARPPRPRRWGTAPRASAVPDTAARPLAIRALAFGLARRPPPQALPS